jgi:hypothetical protein
MNWSSLRTLSISRRIPHLAPSPRKTSNFRLCQILTPAFRKCAKSTIQRRISPENAPGRSHAFSESLLPRKVLDQVVPPYPHPKSRQKRRRTCRTPFFEMSFAALRCPERHRAFPSSLEEHHVLETRKRLLSWFQNSEMNLSHILRKNLPQMYKNNFNTTISHAANVTTSALRTEYVREPSS